MLLRNVVPLDNTQLAPVGKIEAFISETIIVSLVWLLGSLLRSVPSLGEKPGTTSVSELSAAPILFSWPELEDWQSYSHGAAIASNMCRTIIAPSFIPPDTAGGAFNCSFGADVWTLRVPACQMDTAASTRPVRLNDAYLRNKPTQQMQGGGGRRMFRRRRRRRPLEGFNIFWTTSF